MADSCNDQGVSLPSELAMKIISHHHGDREALRNDCLVCKDWCNIAQPHILSVARLSSLGDLVKWEVYTSSSPHILQLLQVVVIDSGREPFIWIGSERYDQRPLLDLSPADFDELPVMPNVRLLVWAPQHRWYLRTTPTILRLFEKFPALEAISLNAKFVTVSQVKLLLTFCNSIKRLELRDEFFLTNYLDELDYGSSLPSTPIYDLTQLEELVLSISSKLSKHSPVDSDWIVGDILHHSPPTALRSLVIQGDRVLTIKSFSRIIRMAAPSLRHLSLQPSSVYLFDRSPLSPLVGVLPFLRSLSLGPINLDDDGIDALEHTTNILLLFPQMLPSLVTLDLSFEVADLQHLSHFLDEVDMADDAESLESFIIEQSVPSQLRLNFLVRNAEKDTSLIGVLEAIIRERLPGIGKHLEISWEFPGKDPKHTTRA